MYTLHVTADKLNIRSSPNADPIFGNWIGDLDKGAIFTAVKTVQGETVDGTDVWYVDDLNRFVSAAWVSDVTDYPWWIKDYGIDKIWETTKGEGIKIAILDTGINAAHFALKPSIKKIEYAAFKTNAANVQQQGDVSDNNGHGTKCAGMVTGIDPANNDNCTGLAPGAAIYIYKVFNDSVGDAPEFLVTGISKAINDNVDIISISRNIEVTPDIISQVQHAVDKKIFVVVCGGNIGDGINPLLSINGVIKIGAINKSGDDLLPGNIGVNAAKTGDLNFYAPGIAIKTTDKSGGFLIDSGTSFSTPFAAGLLALKLAKTDRKNPSFYDSVLNDLAAAIEINSSKFKVINPSKFIV